MMNRENSPIVNLALDIAKYIAIFLVVMFSVLWLQKQYGKCIA